MKTDLFTATEALKYLNTLKDRKLGSGALSLKVYDAADILTQKGRFLEEEINKIIREYGAGPADLENNDSRMVVKDEDGEINEERTAAFVKEVIDMRTTEVELPIKPFTAEDIEKMDPTPGEIGKIRFMIEIPEEPEVKPDNVIALE